MACGVGHPVQPLSDVRRADARSAQISRPEGVCLCFQVSVNKVEPSEAVLARNLGPDADTGEKVALRELSEHIGRYILN